ncbi:MAG: hypothetical protein V2A74_10340 [bacterium]
MRSYSSYRMTLGLIWILIALPCPSFAQDADKTKDIRRIGSELQLFVDDWLIEQMNGVALRMHEPQRREIVFRYDAPWEGKDSGYVTMIKDGENYRMYYRGGGELSQEVTCVAESKDGIKWERPSLGVFEFNGSKENNIVWKGKEKAYWESHSFAPFLDENPAVKPEERYKAIALSRYPEEDVPERKNALFAFASPDGIHWKRMQPVPIISKGDFDSQNTAFWDSARGRYVAFSRMRREGKRSIQWCESQDYIRWSEPVLCDFGGAPNEHLYTNAIGPYFRSPGILLGFPMRFVPDRHAIGVEKREVEGVSDGVFMSSRDGAHWDRRFMEAFIPPGLRSTNWGSPHGNNMPAWGILPTSENEISIYWQVNCEEIPEQQRGTIRTDGFVSVNAPYAGGEFVTRPLAFEGKNLILNYSTSAVGNVRVEIQDEKGKSLEGFAIGDCDEIYGDEIARVVSWNGKSDVSTLAGKTVRLRFAMKDADLYSMRFE